MAWQADFDEVTRADQLGFKGRQTTAPGKAPSRKKRAILGKLRHRKGSKGRKMRKNKKAKASYAEDQDPAGHEDAWQDDATWCYTDEEWCQWYQAQQELEPKAAKRATKRRAKSLMDDGARKADDKNKARAKAAPKAKGKAKAKASPKAKGKAKASPKSTGPGRPKPRGNHGNP